MRVHIYIYMRKNVTYTRHTQCSCHVFQGIYIMPHIPWGATGGGRWGLILYDWRSILVPITYLPCSALWSGTKTTWETPIVVIITFTSCSVCSISRCTTRVHIDNLKFRPLKVPVAFQHFRAELKPSETSGLARVAIVKREFSRVYDLWWTPFPQRALSRGFLM